MTTTSGFTLFETAIGPCAIAWGERGIVGVGLPERDANATRARMKRRCAGARESTPPPEVKRAIDGIVALLQGEPSDLSAVVLDMERVPAFERRVYDAARTIPPGATKSYGEIARQIGEPGEAREVGRALGHNPFPMIVPCHRVLAAGGTTGGFSAKGGVTTKFKILAIEGAVLV